MNVNRLSHCALFLGLVLGIASTALAGGSNAFVKYGSSGQAYYWESGGC